MRVVDGRYRACFRLRSPGDLSLVDETLAASKLPRQRRGVESDSSTVMAHWIAGAGEEVVCMLDGGSLAESWQGQRGDLEQALAGQ